MNRLKTRCLPLFLLLSLALPLAAAQENNPPRDRRLMDAGWRFAFGHRSDYARDFDHGTSYFSYVAKAGYGDGPAAANFDDAAWRKLDLPHDWAVEVPFSPNGNLGHGAKAVGRNFPESSVGWYRKSFVVPASDLGRRISIEFDGVYRDSVVWINGFYLGRQPSGYTGFSYDLTDYLNYGGENVISVRADATVEEGWFYEGAGIYRHVWLTRTDPLHVATLGTYVTTNEVTGNTAGIDARTTVVNDGTAASTFDLEQEIFDDTGRSVAKNKVVRLGLAPGLSAEWPVTLTVARPRLWSLETPTLYKLVTTINRGGKIVDRYETKFGIRTILFDPDQGFFLNGQHVELKGTNNHQDFAGAGVALPDALQDYRVRLLKEMGGNAWRCSHNPPTPELLEACDRLGLLVIDEHRLMGSSPEQLGSLEAMIRRDRNHPSVILWSLGNEEWAIEGNIKGARIAASMQAFAQRLDPTRRTTVAISGGWGGTSTTIDVAGFNYIKQANTDKQHAAFPRQIGVGTEETTTQATRGVYFDDKASAHWSPQLDGTSGGNAESGWKHYAARPYLAGVFYWTGFDYRGETTPFGWPAISSQFGILDTCGFPKDGFYYLQSWWTDKPVLHVFPHWNWPGREGQEINVSVNSNHEAVELLLNGRSLGKKEMPRNGHLEWKVAYQTGAIEARGYREGTVVQVTRNETTGQPAGLRLVPDRTTLKGDGEDATAVKVEVVDAAGRVVPTAGDHVTFELRGPGRFIGVGNGDPSSHEPDQFIDSTQLITLSDWRGRIAPAGTTAPAREEIQSPLTELGNWQAPRPKAGEVYDLAGTFALEAVTAQERFKIFLPTLGIKTSLWVNGHELARDLDTSVNGPAFQLETSQLVIGQNRVQLIVTPATDQRNHIPELTRLGAVQIVTPALPWQRSVFNGLALVLVQSGKESGTLELTAKAKDLPPSTITLTSVSAPPRPSVP